MNHLVYPRLAFVMAPVALMTLVATGCGEAFSNDGPGGGGGTTVTSTTGIGGATPTTASASTGSGSGAQGSVCTWGAAASPQCATGLFCKDSACGVPTDKGLCEAPPFLPNPTKYEPFCGCNGVTYWNAGYAASKKMSGKLGYCAIPWEAAACTAAGGTLVKHGSKDTCEGGANLCMVTPAGCFGAAMTALDCNGNCMQLCHLVTSQLGFREDLACK
jgi:hypothetical protein